MFGDKALDLVKELKRSMDGTLPPYNVRFCLTFDEKVLAGICAVLAASAVEMLWFNLILFLVQFLIYLQS